MNCRLIVNDFHCGIQAVMSEVARSWAVDQLVRAGWDQGRFAEKLRYHRTTVTHWLNGDRPIDPSAVALMVVAFANEERTNPDFRSARLPDLSHDLAVVYGLAHAVDGEGRRRGASGYTFASLSYWLMRGVLDEDGRAWRRAVARGDRRAMEAAAADLISRARRRVAGMPPTPDREDASGNLVRPDHPPPADAAGLQKLFKTWHRHYEAVIECITLRPGGD